MGLLQDKGSERRPRLRDRQLGVDFFIQIGSHGVGLDPLPYRGHDVEGDKKRQGDDDLVRRRLLRAERLAHEREHDDDARKRRQRDEDQRAERKDREEKDDLEDRRDLRPLHRIGEQRYQTRVHYCSLSSVAAESSAAVSEFGTFVSSVTLVAVTPRRSVSLPA